ncbi:MAG: glutamate--tRNA ligase family protein, partial [Limnobacter sp.]|nr:glutamate--tRNA ligase family protein [Limnobacter sp.]
EDIDEGRCDVKWSKEIIHTLGQHGLVSDQEPWIQSERYGYYQTVLETLQGKGLIYPCGCTRKDIEKANAHRALGENRIYPGTCAQGMPKGKSVRSFRLRCPKEAVQWSDWRLGNFLEYLQATSGDFVLKRGDGFWAYHLAVVVDDIASGVTHIVRGEDLVETTARQVALYQALGQQPPFYWHLPIILAEDGQKLSKQTGAAAISGNLPINNLNAVWKHFALPSINADRCQDWLNEALPLWAAYRQHSKASAR